MCCCRLRALLIFSKRASISSRTFGVYRTTSLTEPWAALSSSTAFSWCSPSTLCRTPTPKNSVRSLTYNHLTALLTPIDKHTCSQLKLSCILHQKNIFCLTFKRTNCRQADCPENRVVYSQVIHSGKISQQWVNCSDIIISFVI